MSPLKFSPHGLSRTTSDDAVSPVCSNCSNVISPEDINVATDVAYCRSCNRSYALSAITHGSVVDANPDLNHPPPGAWHRVDGTEIVVGATHRSTSGALGALAVSLFWNSLLLVFVGLALAATFHNLGVQLPEWAPTPRMNGKMMGWGMTALLWLFLTPFMLVGVAMIPAFLSYVAGRTELRINSGSVAFFSGIGFLGRRKRFQVADVNAVRLDFRQIGSDRTDRQKTKVIVIEFSAETAPVRNILN